MIECQRPAHVSVIPIDLTHSIHVRQAVLFRGALTMHGLGQYFKHVCALQFFRDHLHHGVRFLPYLPIYGRSMPL